VGGDITPRLYHSIEFSPGVFDILYIHPNRKGASVALVYLAQLSAGVRDILLGQLPLNIDATPKSNA
jgi:hypothetical protein